jgi:hypothetical protein
MNREKWRSRLKGKAFLLALLALALLGGLGAGIGLGGGFLPNPPARGQNIQSTAEKTETQKASETQKNKYILEVQENAFFYNGTAYRLEDLRTALLNTYTGKETIELIDNHAIKAAYDAIKTMLEEIQIPCVEK